LVHTLTENAAPQEHVCNRNSSSQDWFSKLEVAHRRDTPQTKPKGLEILPYDSGENKALYLNGLYQ